MTKVVLVHCGSLYRLTIEARLELIRRNSGMVKTFEYSLEEEELYERTTLMRRRWSDIGDGFRIDGVGSSIRKGTTHYYFMNDKIDDPALVALAEERGDSILESGHIVIVDIPDDIQWHLAECDGDHWIAEVHRVWRLNYDGSGYYEDTEP